MKVNINLNGKTAELDIPDEKLVELGLVEKKKLTGYERVENRADCFKVFGDGSVNNDYERYGKIDTYYDCANYYSDFELAKANARADTLMRKLRRFAAENGGIPSAEDWKDGKIIKYSLYVRYWGDTPVIRCNEIYICRDPFQIYFKSEEACRKAIEEFKDELTWYFAEYQAMLY